MLLEWKMWEVIKLCADCQEANRSLQPSRGFTFLKEVTVFANVPEGVLLLHISGKPAEVVHSYQS